MGVSRGMPGNARTVATTRAGKDSPKKVNVKSDGTSDDVASAGSGAPSADEDSVRSSSERGRSANEPSQKAARAKVAGSTPTTSAVALGPSGAAGNRTTAVDREPR